MLPTATLASPAEAERLISQGVELRRQGKDSQALPLFRKAYDLAPTPRTAAQVGLVEMALGYQLDAERHLLEALAVPKDLWIRRNRETLDRALQTVRASIGEVTVDGIPTAADVFVNGTLVGKVPLAEPVRVGQGPATVKVVAPGFAPHTVSVTIRGGKREDVHVQLERERPVPPPVVERVPMQRGTEAAAAKAAVQVAATDGLESQDASSQEGGTDRAGLRIAAWATGAAAVAAVGFGAFETWRWQNKLKTFNGVLTPSPSDPTRKVAACGTADPNRGSLPVCEELYGELTQARTLAIVGYVVGGVLAAGSAILFVVSATDDEPKSRHAFACGPSALTAKGFSCTVTF